MALLLARGVGSALGSSHSGSAPVQTDALAVTDVSAGAFAVHFARTYLANPAAEAVAPFMAEGAHVGTGRAPTVETAEVAQAEVSGTEELSGGESVVTVECELRDARTLYLAVPVVRSDAGEVAVTGAPWFVAGPGMAAGVGSERPRPLAGSDGPEIESLVSRFLPLYLGASEADELSYLLTPGAVVEPLAGEFELKALAGVLQLGTDSGSRRSVLAGARVADPGGGATYPIVYRLSVVRGGQGDRWYVAAVEGVSR